MNMETLSVSRFKATCLAVLERVRQTGQEVLVTKRGEPMARVLPPPLPEPATTSRFGCRRGTLQEVAGVGEPAPLAGLEDDWAVWR